MAVVSGSVLVHTPILLQEVALNAQVRARMPLQKADSPTEEPEAAENPTSLLWPIAVQQDVQSRRSGTSSALVLLVHKFSE